MVVDLRKADRCRGAETYQKIIITRPCHLVVGRADVETMLSSQMSKARKVKLCLGNPIRVAVVDSLGEN